MDLDLWQPRRDQENVPHNPQPDVTILAKRKIVRNGAEEVWEQGVVSGPHGDIPFARPVKRGAERRSSTALPASASDAQQRQQQEAPLLPPQGDDMRADDPGVPPAPSLPAPAAAEAAARAQPAQAHQQHQQQLAAAGPGAIVMGEVSCSEDESDYNSEYDSDADMPKLQFTPFGPGDVAQLRAVLQKMREASEADAEPSTSAAAADWDDIITKTCIRLAGMPQTLELTARLRHEMVMLEATAAAALRRAHERRLVRRLGEMREAHRRWQQQVGKQADEQLAAWSGHAVAQQLLDREGASREEFLQHLEDRVQRMQALLNQQQKQEQECRWLTTELVERFGDVRPTPAEVTPLPDHGSRTKNVAMAILALITENFTEDDEP